ncbi:hypothetical protein IEQ34_022861 [Dendrobium chrysotoxum]|uniref:Uncharacterized protein n=1 Tax=Dendrobium chrysotoxum TaxID=161865 RepID=A0AAV7FZ25_DENCH|nr:hypothetical protein IEQ34_022861 [Dendrobium chrysotoxum]
MYRKECLTIVGGIQFAYQINIQAHGNEDAEEYMFTAMSGMAENVEFIMEGKKITTILNAKLGCRPKGISNARLKGHWEKRKSKKLKPTEKNSLTTEQFIAGDLVSQASFLIYQNA